MHGFGSPDYNMGAIVGLLVGGAAVYFWSKKDEKKTGVGGLGYSGNYGPAFMGLGYYGGGRRPSPRNPQPRPLYGLGARTRQEAYDECIRSGGRFNCGLNPKYRRK